MPTRKPPTRKPRYFLYLGVNEEDFEHLSPSPFEHINRLGKYSFWGKIEVAEDGLRPLRQTEN